MKKCNVFNEKKHRPGRIAVQDGTAVAKGVTSPILSWAWRCPRCRSGRRTGTRAGSAVPRCKFQRAEVLAYCSVRLKELTAGGHGEHPAALRATAKCTLPPRQPVQDLDAAVERAVVGGVADAEVGVAAAEDVAGDDEQVVADRLGDELGAGAPRGASGRGRTPRPASASSKRSLQARDDAVALAAVVGDDGRRRRSPRRRRRRAARCSGRRRSVNCWSLVISSISRRGPWAKPSRQPVMP